MLGKAFPLLLTTSHYFPLRYAVGKTALALALKEQVSKDGGFFLQGKFDELWASAIVDFTNTHGPFVQALSEYCHQVVTSGDQSLIDSVREALSKNMNATELRILTTTVPNVIQLFGPSENGASQLSRRIVLQGAEAEDGLIYIICKYLQTISSEGYPIVLFLDDVQWSTPDAIALLEAIVDTVNNTNDCRLLVICTCRETDTDSSNHFCWSLQSGDQIASEIKLHNLNFDAVHDFLSDCLGVDSLSKHLTRIVLSITQGNPFYILQLVNELQEARSLSASQWDELAPQHFAPVQSVGFLVKKRIGRLPKATKELLKIASCIGTALSEECLQAAVLSQSSEVIAAVRCALEEGIFEQGLEPNTVRFTHDEFRQAAYTMIPENDRKAVHLDVGRRIWYLLPKARRDDYLLLVADQISCVMNLVKEEDERAELARLFLLAGQKAAQVPSFSAAAGYLQCGIRIMGSSH